MKYKLVLSLMSLALTAQSAPSQFPKLLNDIPSSDQFSWEEEEGSKVEQDELHESLNTGSNCTAREPREFMMHWQTTEKVLLMFAIVGVGCTLCAILDCLCSICKVGKDKGHREVAPNPSRELKPKPQGGNAADERLYSLVQAMVALGAFLMASKKHEMELKKRSAVHPNQSNTNRTKLVVESKETIV